MSHPSPYRVSLTAHPSTPSAAIEAVEVELISTAAGALALEYSLRGDMTQILVAPEARAGGAATAVTLAEPTDDLWKHTCFEAFIREPAMSSYYELNFSPARQWAAYRFSAYREGMRPLRLVDPPEISANRSPNRLQVRTLVRLPHEAGEPQRLRLGLAAVIEERSGRLSYWAAAHPRGKPDFHHPDGFVLEL